MNSKTYIQLKLNRQTAGVDQGVITHVCEYMSMYVCMYVHAVEYSKLTVLNRRPGISPWLVEYLRLGTGCENTEGKNAQRIYVRRILDRMPQYQYHMDEPLLW